MPTRQGWQLLKERQDVATLQLTADDHFAIVINAVDLKYRLGNVETDCRDRLHDLAPPNRGGFNSTHIHGTHVPVEEPSTASTTDLRSAANKFHHSITSSARTKSVGGIVNPSALAVFRLITSSNLLLCWTGRSAGLAPLRICPV